MTRLSGWWPEVSTRTALEDVRAVAEPSPGLTALQSQYDAHEASIDSLLQAEWQHFTEAVRGTNTACFTKRRDPQRGTRPSCTMGETQRLFNVRQHLNGQPCRISALASRIVAERANAGGGDCRSNSRDTTDAPAARPSSDATTIKLLAAMPSAVCRVAQRSGRLPGLAETIVAPDRRSRGDRRPRADQPCGMAGTLQAPTRATPRESLARAAVVYRETLDLNDGMKALMLVARGGAAAARQLSEAHRRLRCLHERGGQSHAACPHLGSCGAHGSARCWPGLVRAHSIT